MIEKQTETEKKLRVTRLELVLNDPKSNMLPLHYTTLSYF
jgi:hypothetical protein